MELKGTVHEVGETIQVTDSFKKRDLIVLYAENPQYPEYIKFEAIQDKVHALTELQVGDDVEVKFNLKGRPSKDKNGNTIYFNQLQVWSIKSTSKPLTAEEKAGGTLSVGKGVPAVAAADEDDLPF